MTDATIAGIARRLVEALRDVGYSRSERDKQAVAVLNTELCEARRTEEAEQATLDQKPKGPAT